MTPLAEPDLRRLAAEAAARRAVLTALACKDRGWESIRRKRIPRTTWGRWHRMRPTGTG